MTLHSIYRHQREKLPLSCLHGFEKRNKRTKKKKVRTRNGYDVNERIEHCVSFASSPSLFPNSNILHQGYQTILYPIYKLLKFFVLYIFVTFSFVIFFSLLLLNKVKLNNKIPSAMLN